MALKKRLTEEERYGLSEEEIKLAEKFLRKHKTAGALRELSKIAQQFAQYQLGQIILTAALRGWAHDRDRMMHTLQDRVRAKVVKSVLEQVDFLTAMMSVAGAEHLETMVKYCQDPINNPKPTMRVTNIKEYKDVAETLYKIVAGATPGAKNNKSPMFEALTPPVEKKGEEKPVEQDAAILLAEVVNADGQNNQ